MTKVAILGASGDIGNYLCDHLVGYKKLFCTSGSFDLLNFNQTNEWFKENKPDVVINCAIKGGNRVHDVDNKIFEDNMTMFHNCLNSRQYFGKYINIGSGAEFDLSKDIHEANEYDTVIREPLQSYGWSKNLIDREIHTLSNFHTLRLFGILLPEENNSRLLKRFFRGEITQLVDRKFDYFSGQDFIKVLDFTINDDRPLKVLNCVYYDKVRLSDILQIAEKAWNKEFNETIDYFSKIQIDTELGKPYTGNGLCLDLLGLNLEGLEQGIKYYVRKQ